MRMVNILTRLHPPQKPRVVVGIEITITGVARIRARWGEKDNKKKNIQSK
jgi:hypothetical protein